MTLPQRIVDNEPRVIPMETKPTHLRLYFSAAGLKNAFAGFVGLRDRM